jgi:monofunctional biosynthetic peptidoglycan transglycosylase
MRAKRSFSLSRLLLHLGLTLIGLFVLLQSFYFVQVLWFRVADPEQSAFMAEQAKQVQQIKHQPVAYQQIAVNLKRAVIAAEDQRFDKHDGIDWDAIEKAWMQNRDKGRVVRGGSTITQQLAKNLFLSGERSYWRKAQEALITLMIEAVMDKQRILHLYLNYAEWGIGIFGAQAAAKHYFGISASQLNAYQAARLAAMLPRPRHYDKHRDSAFLASRTEFVLRWMGQMQVP